MDSLNDITAEVADKSTDSKSPVDKINKAIYRYKRSRLSISLTIITLLIGIFGFIALLTTSSGSYLSAWYLSLVIAVLLLFILSFPRYIKLSDSSIEIHCMLEVTAIPYNEIVRVCKIRSYMVKYHLPIMGSYGFGGYFGYYINLKQLKIIRYYATNLKSLVAIEDVYSDIYIVSCEDRDVFIREINLKREKLLIDTNTKYS